MSSDARLPVSGFKGGIFRIHSGPKPRQAEAFVVLGLEQSDAMARSRFDVTINGQPCEQAPDLTDLTTFSGVARAVRFTCPVKALREGFNEVHSRQQPGEPEQKIVWLELQIQPDRN